VCDGGPQEIRERLPMRRCRLRLFETFRQATRRFPE
jgi:hypothetical protein